MTPDDERDRVSEFLYPFLVAEQGVSEAEVLAEARVSTLQKCQEVVELRRQVLARHADDLLRCAVAMADRFRHGATLLAFGNGGSATDAQDIVADCMLVGLPALALTNDIGVVTAVGNDVGFENVFARQVIAFGRPGDIAMGISTSGSSKNVLLALEQARKQGLLTIGIVGYDGGPLATLGLDFCFVVPSTYVPRIQEAQATIYHTLWDLVRQALDTRQA